MRPAISAWTLAGWVLAAGVAPAVHAQPRDAAAEPVAALAPLVQQALQVDPNLRAAAAAYASEQAGVDMARSALLPKVDLSASRGANRLARDVNLPVSYVSSVTTLNLRQPLVQSDGRARVAVAEAEARRQKSQHAQAQDEVAYATVAGWAEVQRTTADVWAAQAQVVAARAQWEASQRGRQHGLFSDTEVVSRRARYDMALQRGSAAALKQGEALRQLARLTGQAVLVPPPLWARSGASPDLPPVPSLEDTVQRAASVANAVRAAEEGVASAQSALERARAVARPTLDLYGALTRSTSEGPALVNSSYQSRAVGLQLTVPLYQGGLGDASVAQAQAQLDRAEALRDLARQDVQSQVATDHQTLQQAAVQLRATREAVGAARRTLASELRGEAAGQRAALDVLEARAQLDMALADDTRAWSGLLQSWTRLTLLTGQDMAATLRTLDQWLAAALERGR